MDTGEGQMIAQRMRFVYAVSKGQVRFPVEAIVFGRRAVSQSRLRELNKIAKERA
jgi:hypothetical protein